MQSERIANVEENGKWHGTAVFVNGALEMGLT